MAKPTRSNARDPRYAHFRVFFYAFYLVVVVAFSVLVIWSVVRSVVAMTPGKRSAVDTALSVGECVDGAERLWRELDAQRQGLATHLPVRKADEEWTQFRLKWLDQFRDIESKCAVDSRSRAPLKRVFERLDHVQDLYTTHAIQFAGEVGGAIDGLRDSFQAVGREQAGR